jgi:hypothetical protein
MKLLRFSDKISISISVVSGSDICSSSHSSRSSGSCCTLLMLWYPFNRICGPQKNLMDFWKGETWMMVWTVLPFRVYARSLAWTRLMLWSTGICHNHIQIPCSEVFPLYTTVKFSASLSKLNSRVQKWHGTANRWWSYVDVFFPTASSVLIIHRSDCWQFSKLRNSADTRL